MSVLFHFWTLKSIFISYVQIRDDREMVWQDEKATMRMRDGLASVVPNEPERGVVLLLPESIELDESREYSIRSSFIV